jgi:uncharacterized membrane protein YebE (DUF533 family)
VTKARAPGSVAAMATNAIMGRDVYLALAAVGWADGQLDQEEADAIVRAALEEGLELDAINEIEEATKKPVSIGVIDRLHMSKSDRLYVYAVASWITRLDGVITEEEESALAKIAEQLGVPEAPRRHADELLQELSSEEQKPARFDLLRLRRILDERLTAAQAARAARKAE